MLFGFIDVPVGDFFQNASLSTTKGHNFKLYKNLSSVTVRAKFFSERIVMFGITYLTVLILVRLLALVAP